MECIGNEYVSQKWLLDYILLLINSRTQNYISHCSFIKGKIVKALCSLSELNTLKKVGYSFLFFTNSKSAHFILAFLETISPSLCFSWTHTFLCSYLSFLSVFPPFCFNDTSYSELAKQTCVLY